MTMKKTTYLFVFLWCIGLLWTACTPKPIDIEIEEAESLPVIWSQALPETGVIVYFAKSFTALSYQEGDTASTSDLLQQMLVTDGRVVLLHNGQVDTLTALSSGVFSSVNTAIVPGDYYTLVAQDFGTGKRVESTAMAYEAVTIDSLNYQRLDSNKLKVTTHFNDPVGSNYYAIHFYARYTNPLTTDDPLAADNVVVTKLITDLEFQDSNVSFEVELEELDSDTLYVSLNNISPTYFDYLGQRLRGGNIYNQLVQEPINYVTNIEGGYGLFTLHLPSVRLLVLPD
jgi:Domain of unknown function (DUF4249)